MWPILYFLFVLLIVSHDSWLYSLSMWTNNRMVGVFPSNYPTGTIKCDVYEFECLPCQAIVDAVFHDNVCQWTMDEWSTLITPPATIYLTIIWVLTVFLFSQTFPFICTALRLRIDNSLTWQTFELINVTFDCTRWIVRWKYTNHTIVCPHRQTI
jgi:hypothetical protein